VTVDVVDPPGEEIAVGAVAATVNTDAVTITVAIPEFAE
jgi:hypothetical protein